MTYLHSIILGIVEGITEFLPISSTGHLILTSHILGIANSEFLKSFEIFIQLGAILAVVFYYRKTLFESGLSVWKKILAAFIPTGIIGFALYVPAKAFVLNNAAVTVVSLIVGGIILVVFEMWKEKSRPKQGIEGGEIIPTYDSVHAVPYKAAAIIGAAQALAIIPGVSRSATTIISGELLSLTRKAVVEFSFLLAVPTMLAASSLDMLKSGWAFDARELSLLAVGFIVSFIVALCVIKWLLKYVEKHSFIAFGMYRILAGLLFFYFFF